MSRHSNIIGLQDTKALKKMGVPLNTPVVHQKVRLAFDKCCDRLVYAQLKFLNGVFKYARVKNVSVNQRRQTGCGLDDIREANRRSNAFAGRFGPAILNDGIGDRKISEIEAPDLLEVLRRVESAGRYESVARLRATASAIFRFGIASGYCKRDPAADLRGALTSASATPHPAVTKPAEVGELMRAIDGFERLPRVRLALQFLALTFVRPGEAVSAEWSEIDGDVWNVPAVKMKMRFPHRVPLSRQALWVLEQLRLITGKRKHLFASSVKPSQPFATNRLNEALREIGFNHDRHVAHGFRSTFSTTANESGKWTPDAIELSLAHVPPGVRGIYNRSEHWAERVALAQWYADHLDELRSRGKVVALPDHNVRVGVGV